MGPPFVEYVARGADPFVYLQGTNCSFRRHGLVEIGGFDEEIEYYLDEVEVCMRLIDQGYKLRPLDKAGVHHKYLASHLRNSKRVVMNPYAIVKNRHYFAYMNGRETRSVREITRILNAYTYTVQHGGWIYQLEKARSPRSSICASTIRSKRRSRSAPNVG